MGEDIYQKLTEAHAINNFQGGYCPFLEVKGTSYKAKYSSFKIITFQSLVHFENTNISIGLFFDSCTFDEPLVFTNIKASGYDSTLNPDSQNIVFKDCTFHGEVMFMGNDSSVERDICFDNCVFKEGLNIERLNITIEGLTIKNCTISKKLDLFNIEAKQMLSLHENKINCFTRIESLICNTLAISGNNLFNDNLHIRYSYFEHSIIFSEGIFKNEVYLIVNKTSTGGISFNSSVFEQSVFIDYHSGNSKPIHGISQFYFSNSEFKNGIYIVGQEDLFADSPIVEKIEINISAHLKGNIVFRGLGIGILEISGYNTSTNISFMDLRINQIKIKALFNSSGIDFSNVKASTENWFDNKEKTILRENAVYISDSNFGKARFYQVDFSSFEKIVFHNNILTEITTSLVKWFTLNQLEGIEKDAIIVYEQAKKSKNNIKIKNANYSLLSILSSRQEIYRQLKFASQKQGDIPQSLVFQRHEMYYYKKIVSIKEPINWSEYLILWTNQTNDFGQNWIKPFCLLILSSFLLYLPIGFFTSNELNYSKFAVTLSDVLINLRVLFCDNLKEWVVILNPAHRLKDINENIDNYTSLLYLFDFLSRIVVSYFIFQTISAFRKFSK